MDGESVFIFLPDHVYMCCLRAHSCAYICARMTIQHQFYSCRMSQFHCFYLTITCSFFTVHRLKHRSANTILLTGLSGSGKTVLFYQVSLNAVIASIFCPLSALVNTYFVSPLASRWLLSPGLYNINGTK